MAVCEHTDGNLVNFVKVFEADLGRQNGLIGRRNRLDRRCRLLEAAMNRIYPSLGRRSANQPQNMLYHDLIESL